MIGIDILQISRVEYLYNIYGKVFAQRILSTKECFTCVLDIAKSFSVKESVSKALGFGLRYPISFHNIYLLKDNFNKPYIEFSNELCKWLLFYFKREIKVSISISHEKDYLVSIAIVSN